MLKPLGVKIDIHDHKQLKKIAKEEERSVGYLIRQAIKLYLKERQAK
jgi:hypothetical protein